MHSSCLRPQVLRIAVCLLAVTELASLRPSSLNAQAAQPGIAGTVKVKGHDRYDQRIEITLLAPDRRPMQKVFADSLGNFLFRGLAPGLYIIFIQERGYKAIEDHVEIPPRSLQLQRRYYMLEAQPVESSPVLAETVSARKFIVSPDARREFERGESELQRRQYQKAAEYLDRAIELAAEFSDALHARGLVHLQLNEPEAAALAFERALAVDPTLADAHIGLGAARFRAGRAAEAVEPLSRGLALAPKSYLGRFERCRAYLQLSRLEEAESDCLRARELAEESDFGLHILMGNLFLRQGRQAEALKEFRQYLRKDSRSATAEAVRKMVESLRTSSADPSQ